jgi:hypothetical protein
MFRFLSSVALAALLAAGAAHATPLTLFLDAGGGNTLTIVDGDANDDSPIANHIQIQSGTTLGGFVFGSNSQLAIQSQTGLLDSNFHLLGSGTLSVQVSKDDYAAAAGPAGVTDDFSLTNIGNSIAYASYLSTSNTMFGTEFLIHSNTATNILDDEFVSVGINLSGPYALTHTYTISQDAGEQSNFVHSTVATPEPESLALFGLGLLGLGVLSRRRKLG